MARLFETKKDKSDEQDMSLRPLKLDDYVGQEFLKNNLRIFIGAALKRNEVLDHVLLYGPPGLGKTTLANIIANEMGVKFKSINGPAIEKIGDLASILLSLTPGDVLFIDEIHRLPLFIEESLYSAMEDFKFSMVINKETTPKTVEFDLPPFTLVGATTKAGCLSSPLRARFGICEKLEYYKVDELTAIIMRLAKVFHMSIDENAAHQIAIRSRGTPRIAIRIFKRVRDYANYKNISHIKFEDTLESLKMLKIDEIGLDEVDRNYIMTLIKRFNGGPVGLETLANAIGEESVNLEDVYEPYLLQIGFIDRTQKGRVARKAAFFHYNLMKNKS